MAWFFYNKFGKSAAPKVTGNLGVGSIISSVLPYDSTPPTGYLFCDGSSVVKNDYLTLFSKIGTVFGSVDINHFNLPDLRSKFPRGIILSSQVIGGTGGSKSHNHVFKTHNHLFDTGNHSHPISSSHTHGFTHAHTLQHTHSMETYSVSPGTTYYRISEPGSQESAADAHKHNISEGALSDGPNVASTDSLVLTSGNNSSPIELTAVNPAAETSTPLSGGSTTSTVSELPPFFATSFLIKY